MTIAEIHGKLSYEKPAHERMEDLLTSDVFGTMQYIGWQYGFIEWLRAAQSPDGQCFAREVLPSNNSIQCVHFEFWPKIENGREPDLALGFETLLTIVQVTIESKYHSGTSDIEINWRNYKSKTGNQIADEINCFGHLFQNPQKKTIENVHMLITKHSSTPSLIYERANAYILRKDVPIFWTNWQSLPNFLRNIKTGDDGRKKMINDLLKLFERKNLIHFEGFKDSTNWGYRELIGKSFWRE